MSEASPTPGREPAPPAGDGESLPSPGSPGLMAGLLPPAVRVAEAFADVAESGLFPEELELITRAVEKRRREFTTARVCAHRALGGLGLPAAPVLRGERGEPLWPAGVAGSLTHCAGYRAAAVAWRSDVVALGIDAEPVGPLPPGVLAQVALPEERRLLADLAAAGAGDPGGRADLGDCAETGDPGGGGDPGRGQAGDHAGTGEPARADAFDSWEHLLFSAKESVYKAWFPLTGAWLGFSDALVTLHPDGAFDVRFLVEVPPAARSLHALRGRWLTRRGLILTAAVVVAPDL